MRYTRPMRDGLTKPLGLLLILGATTALLLPTQADLRRRARTALDNNDFPQALALYRQALNRESNSPYRWADLAEAYSASGDIPDAEKCFARARQLGPHIPPIWIRDANFHFEIGQTAPALEASARVLETVPDYDSVLFTSFDRLIPDPNQVIAAIGADRRASLSWFHHLLDTNALDPAQIAWNDLVTHKFADDKLAATYIDDLLRNHKYDLARDSWITYLGPRRQDYPDRNLLFNGNFKTEPTGCPFDWINLRQIVRVHPGPHRLTAWTRTANEDLRIRVFDTEDAARLDFRTEPLVHPIVAFIEIPAETNLVTVEILGRGPVDHVSLTRDP